jgi:hypothetical protein
VVPRVVVLAGASLGLTRGSLSSILSRQEVSP